MKIVILHYHMNPGGVTRIIESQIRGIQSISKEVELVILCGNHGKIPSIPGTRAYVNESLNYWDGTSRKLPFGAEADYLTTWIKSHLTEDAVLHCHNPNLGKNPALTLAVYTLAEEGYAIVNHCHDFPEERPANIEILEKIIPAWSGLSLSRILYPHIISYHYITLNSCDYKRLLEKNIPVSCIHLIPNPVSPISQVNPGQKPELRNKICQILGFRPTRKICTYPVRAIERKNLGEFILLAALFADTADFTVTLAPQNPVELPGYNNWKEFCREYGLPMKFESGELVNHEELINISDFCITTSVREGFGMVYIEPWMAGTPVIGRDLPCITADLKKSGVELRRIYPAILVRKGGELVDFKDLKVMDQMRVITGIISRKSERLRLMQDNPFLGTFLEEFPRELILRNREIVKSEFSVEKYGKKLFAVYTEISE